MFIFIMLGIIALCAGLIAFGWWITENTSHDFIAVLFWFFGVVGIAVAGLLLIAYAFASTSAPIKAKLINDAYGTNYTTEDLIWGDGIITEVIQGKKSRIDLTVDDKK